MKGIESGGSKSPASLAALTYRLEFMGAVPISETLGQTIVTIPMYFNGFQLAVVSFIVTK